MALRAMEGQIIVYTATYGVYQVLTTTGKRKVAKDLRPVDQIKKDSDEEDTSQWPTKPVQNLEDIADGHQGRNYSWHCPEKEGCPEETHAEKQEQETPPDSPSQQLFREQTEPPLVPQKPVQPEPRQSERMGRDVTNWQDRIKQGLAGGPKNLATNRVGHNAEDPIDEQARLGPKAHEWCKARQVKREKLQKYGCFIFFFFL